MYAVYVFTEIDIVFARPYCFRSASADRRREFNKAMAWDDAAEANKVIYLATKVN